MHACTRTFGLFPNTETQHIYLHRLLKGCEARTLHVLVQVPDNRRLADPPLMRLESEGGHAYLSILLQLSATQIEVQQQAEVEARLVSLSLATLQRFQVCHDLAVLHFAAAHMLVPCSLQTPLLIASK